MAMLFDVDIMEASVTLDLQRMMMTNWIDIIKKQIKLI